jgi:hypothetical protein
LPLEGNAWSARFPRLMGSRSLVLKATAFTEWNGAGFPAHVGYVPVNVDYSDIHSVLALSVPLSPSRPQGPVHTTPAVIAPCLLRSQGADIIVHLLSIDQLQAGGRHSGRCGSL